ncbi:FAD/NAD-P-binding domain-containing protein [Syncephalastrum racemosum]|uniref:FAD/NAD-P-binding domain-containing protein n=1 Tax=Syncephalastrum racemosum TaxID=13706 RepID=A0A1X2HTW1_SYNRA|nr:FAD/NAD-P-binding domain-containing protein [Syncephalastrum racemosum]
MLFTKILSVSARPTPSTTSFVGGTHLHKLWTTRGSQGALQQASLSTRTLRRSQGRVVILGSGWAGFKLKRELNKKDYDVTVISPRNFFIFTPLLAGTAVGSLEPRCIIEPVRGYSTELEYHQAWCDKIDIKKQKIYCSSNLVDNKGKPFELDYDKLVIAVGAYSNTFNTPGVKEHAIFLKQIDDARRIRSRILECFEYACQPGITEEEKRDKLHFAVVGGGPTGIEFSAELYDFITEDLSRLYPGLIRYTRMTVYDVAPKILGSFDQKLSGYATQKFRRRGIQVKTGTHVLEVGPDGLKLKEEGHIPAGMVVWATGLAPNPLVESMTSVVKDEKSHRVMTDRKLRVLDKETREPIKNVYALGDCATIEEYDLPATAQVANQKAIYLGKVFNKEVKLGQEDPKQADFTFASRGSMAYIGKWEAVVDMSPINEKATEGGHMAWVFWRSAYLSMSVSMRNKLLIPMFWFMTWAFGRDVSRF